MFCKERHACFARFSTFSSKFQKYILLHIVAMNEHGWIFLLDFVVVLVEEILEDNIYHLYMAPSNRTHLDILNQRDNTSLQHYNFRSKLNSYCRPKIKLCKFNNIPMFDFSIPSGGFRNLIFGLSIASRNILVSCALPSHSAQTNVNCMSKLHVAIIFWVGTHFLPINGIWFSCDTQTHTCVPLIALIQFYIKKIVCHSIEM
jgi:hypothetical protein